MKRFWAQEAEMSLTPISSLESAWKKFLTNSTYMMSIKKESNVFGLRRPKWVKQPIARPNRREENFSRSRRTSCLESRNQTFFGSGGRNESNSNMHVYKVGIKRVWAQEAEMSLTPISWLESARRYFSWTRRTWCLESSNETFLGSRGQNESNTHQFARIGLKKISHEFDVHDVYKIGIKRFWAQKAELGKTANSSPESSGRKFFMNSTYIMSRK